MKFAGIRRLFLIKPSELSTRRVARAIWARIRFIPDIFIYHCPWGWNALNRRRLAGLNNSHKGGRCFIIASGPSLKFINFDLLRNETTFAMNRGYMMREQMDFSPTYLVCIDVKTQLTQFTKEYDAVNYLPTFYNWDLRHLFSKKDNRYFIKTKFGPAFTTAFPAMLGSGKSVTYSCIQMAFIMGFDEVYLIGKDHSYSTKSKPHEHVKITGSDDNHFLKNYYKKGQIYDAPDLAGEEFAYRVARGAYEENGRKIMDATVNGKLTIFEKVDFYSLFPGAAKPQLNG